MFPQTPFIMFLGNVEEKGESRGKGNVQVAVSRDKNKDHIVESFSANGFSSSFNTSKYQV